MSSKRYKPEQIVNLLRQIEVEIANGKTTPQGGMATMDMNRRKFLGVTSAAGAGLLAARPTRGRGANPETEKAAYKYRLAFNCWMNDVRSESMPLEDWPCEFFDDKTVDGIVRALDVQAEAGYTTLDILGLWTTHAWPVDIKSVADKDRVRRVNQVLKAAHERKMKVITFPCGIMSWGMDEIIQHDPAVRGDDKHNMNPLREESWQWAYKLFDFAMDNYDLDGFHLESADEGRCKTKECMEKWPNNVAYHCYVTGRMADYIRRKDPKKILIATIQSFTTWDKGLTEEEKTDLVELSKSVDCLFDQGHGGTYVRQAEWPGFIQRLHCAYGTSGGIWVFPPQRWERTRWFLPYTFRTGKHIKELYEAGGRGIMYYQGPVINPSTEVNIAFGGRIMTNVGKSIEDVLADTLESLYRPKNAAAHRKLVEIFQRAENVYFEQWNEEKFLEVDKNPGPGELKLMNMFGDSNQAAATYLTEPRLDADGRLKYNEGLGSIYKDISKIEDEFNDNGRIGQIKQGISEALVDINNIAFCKCEK
jgi:hypothetical protein